MTTKSKVSEVIGHTIAEKRKEKGINQKKFAQILGISNTTLSLYERGERTPDIEVLLKIAEYFNLSLDELCGNVFRNVGSKNKFYKLETVGDLARIIIELDNVCKITPIYKAMTVLDDKTERYYSENYGEVIDKVIENIYNDRLSPEETKDNMRFIDTAAGFIFDDGISQGVGGAIQKFSERFSNAKEVRQKLKDMGDEYATDVYNTLLNKAIDEAAETFFSSSEQLLF